MEKRQGGSTGYRLAKFSTTLTLERQLKLLTEQLEANCPDYSRSPKLDRPMTVPGVPKITVLVKLKASARNWRLTFSLMLKVLKRERSRFLVQSWRTEVIVRAIVPKV